MPPQIRPNYPYEHNNIPRLPALGNKYGVAWADSQNSIQTEISIAGILLNSY